MEERISLYNLCPNSVTVMLDKYVSVESKDIHVSNHAKAYINSLQGRASVEAEVAEPYKTAILAVWGDVPTVTEE
jgi:uncharacterized iron-regulated protein